MNYRAHGSRVGWRDRPVTGSMSGVSQAYPIMAFRQQADALANAGELDQARALLEDVVADARVQLGEDDPDVLATAHHLATLHRRADDPAAARRVLEEAYAAGQWRLGDADPLMLEISFDLGMIAAELGNRHEARIALSRVAETGASVLGADHWAVQQARVYLDKDPSIVRVDDSPDPASDAYPAIPAQRPAGEPQPGEAAGVGEAESETARLGGEDEAYPGDDGTVPEPADPTGAASHGTDRPAYQKRGLMISVIVTAALAVIIAVTALIFALTDDQSNTKDNVPTMAGAPPSDVRLMDLGTSIKLTWLDPAQGKVTFVVTGGHPGDHLLKPMGQTGPGDTTYELQGLSTQLDYCFAVVAVYGSSAFASSPQVCTSRVHPSRTQ